MTKPKTLQELETPAFIINRHAFVKNCSRALEVASKAGMRLRPHIKTHKTLEGAWLQATGGYSEADISHHGHVPGFIASTLPEVELLVRGATSYGGPFSDILFGIPISQTKLARLAALREKLPEGGKINIIIDHEQQVVMVEDFMEKLCSPAPHKKPKLTDPAETKVWPVFLKLDTGYHRAGITCDDRGVQLALKVLDSPLLELAGVYSHWYVLIYLLTWGWFPDMYCTVCGSDFGLILLTVFSSICCSTTTTTAGIPMMPTTLQNSPRLQSQTLKTSKHFWSY
jgi:D-serine deaminase-like pyridoxal phosphate-dependent protein